ncbi:MAG TPA: carboxypeptidase-like regulatory domain-containing protein [Bryobacteraceae bacterium]|nr:carboxypeptidase-like regulatory domain-containing protein [Bryobacteraceae bacterium]
MSILRALLVLAACSGYAICQPAAGFKMAGHVVRRPDNRPAKRVRVSIAAIGGADRQISCLTGDNGEFSFAGLPPAKYTLQVNEHGGSELFLQTDEFSTAIAVGPDLDSEHIVFPLHAPARITGSVLDQEGDPVAGALVYLFVRSILRGLVQTQLSTEATTSADGDFHFAHLTPGTYYVAATGHPWYAQNFQLMHSLHVAQPVSLPEPRSELDLAYPLVYYDGGYTPEAATPLKLDEGANAEIHFTLRAVPAVHIAADGFQKQEGQQPILQLFHPGPGGTLIGMAWGADSGVAPGNYIVSSSLVGQNQTSTLGSQLVSLTADATVHLDEAVQTSVKGKVTLDGDMPPSMGIWLGNLINGSPVTGILAPDGTFDIPNIPPGRYALLLANASDLYMQSVKVKGGVYRNGELPVAKGAEIQLTINAVKGVTQVNGRVVNGTKPIAGAMVLLFPHDPSHGNNIPRDQSDSDGTFTLNWALPGRYTLVAIDHGRGLAYADPAVIAPYLQAGQVLDLPLAKDSRVEIEVQSVGQVGNLPPIANRRKLD